MPYDNGDITDLKMRVQRLEDQHKDLRDLVVTMHAEQRQWSNELMSAINGLSAAQVRNEGMQEASKQWWKRIGIGSGVVATMIALGWISDRVEASKVVMLRDTQQHKMEIKREEDDRE